MASPPLKNVSPNQPLEFEAAQINLWNETAENYRLNKGRPGARALPKRPRLPYLTVNVRNDTGDDLPARSVLQVINWVGSPVDYPFEAADNPSVAGDIPDASSNPIVILLEAIPKGQFGPGIIQGVAFVDVVVNDEDHEFAVPIADDYTQLESAASGSVRILDWETSGDTRRAMVLMTPGGGQSITGGEYTDHAVTGGTELALTGMDLDLPDSGPYFMQTKVTLELTDDIDIAGMVYLFIKHDFEGDYPNPPLDNGDAQYSFRLHNAGENQTLTMTTWKLISFLPATLQTRVLINVMGVSGTVKSSYCSAIPISGLGGGGGGGGSDAITVGTTEVSGANPDDLLTNSGGVLGSASLSSLLIALGGTTGEA